MGITTHGTVAVPDAGDEHRRVDIPSLTGLRAFAASVVVVHHLRGLTPAFGDDGVVTGVRRWLDAGALGVDVFFVLSGFVIAHTYAHRLATPVPGARRDYLVARLARVYPLHLVTLLALVAIIVVGGVPAVDPDGAAHYSVFALLGNVFMLQALPGVYPWNFPSWSISCELAAYLVFPLFAARLVRARWTTALALALAGLCLPILLIHGSNPDDLATPVAYWSRIAGEFAAGALLWVVWRRRLRPGPWGDVLAVLCVAGAAWVAWDGRHVLMALPLLAVLVPAVAGATGPVRALLTHPVAQWGGRVSFALYLSHIAVMTFVAWFMPSMQGVPSPGAATVYVVVVAIAAVAVAAVLHHGVEEPTRRWLRRRFAGGGAGVSALRPEESAPRGSA